MPQRAVADDVTDGAHPGVALAARFPIRVCAQVQRSRAVIGPLGVSVHGPLVGGVVGRQPAQAPGERFGGGGGEFEVVQLEHGVKSPSRARSWYSAIASVSAKSSCSPGDIHGWGGSDSRQPAGLTGGAQGLFGELRATEAAAQAVEGEPALDGAGEFFLMFSGAACSPESWP